MYAIVVYDTASERNPRILRTCRRYLHHTQFSVFEGHLTPAQLRRLQHAITELIKPDYDRVLIYAMPPGTEPNRIEIGAVTERPETIL